MNKLAEEFGAGILAALLLPVVAILVLCLGLGTSLIPLVAAVIVALVVLVIAVVAAVYAVYTLAVAYPVYTLLSIVKEFRK